MNGVDISSLVSLGSGVVVLLIMINYMSTRDKSQAERDNQFAEALDKLTESNEKIAVSTERSANEAAQRNGHLAELQLETQKLVAANQKATLKGLKELKSQPVIKQDVYKQVITNAEVKG